MPSRSPDSPYLTFSIQAPHRLKLMLIANNAGYMLSDILIEPSGVYNRVNIEPTIG